MMIQEHQMEIKLKAVEGCGRKGEDLRVAT
jgi:hypothetical protein